MQLAAHAHGQQLCRASRKRRNKMCTVSTEADRVQVESVQHSEGDCWHSRVISM